jgi:hypothetical protein
MISSEMMKGTVDITDFLPSSREQNGGFLVGTAKPILL